MYAHSSALNLFNSGFFMTVFLIVYLFQTFPLYKMAERANLKNSWFAFIPILNFVIILNLVDYSGWILLALMLLLFIPIIGGLIVFIFQVCISIKLARSFELGVLGQILIIFFGIFVEYYIVLAEKPYVGQTKYSMI